MSEQQSSTQVGIIVVAHADYGSAMLRTAEFILGTLSDCTSISVDIAQEVPETVRRLDDAAQRLDKGAGVIILTDMFGGTPTNLALSLLGSHNVEVVTGVNLPMLLKVFTCREKPLAELAKLAGEAGTKGIVVAGSMLRSRNKEKQAIDPYALVQSGQPSGARAGHRRLAALCGRPAPDSCQ